jgi:hypothetical protein
VRSGILRGSRPNAGALILLQAPETAEAADTAKGGKLAVSADSCNLAARSPRSLQFSATFQVPDGFVYIYTHIAYTTARPISSFLFESFVRWR